MAATTDTVDGFHLAGDIGTECGAIITDVANGLPGTVANSISDL
ncbi:MAG: hypothetical protein ACLQBD_03210 [Syntrophobacteraceae bacterium]